MNAETQSFLDQISNREGWRKVTTEKALAYTGVRGWDKANRSDLGSQIIEMWRQHNEWMATQDVHKGAVPARFDVSWRHVDADEVGEVAYRWCREDLLLSSAWESAYDAEQAAEGLDKVRRRQREIAIELVSVGTPKTQIAKALKVSRPTLDAWVKSAPTRP